VDFYCLAQRLVIEVDGSQHAERTAHDEERTKWLERCGERLLRFWNNEVLTNVEGVAHGILEALENPHLNPPPPGEEVNRYGLGTW